MFKKFAVAGAIALGMAGSASAATVRPILLDEIIDTAAIAFHGTCVANRVELDAATGFIVTYSTFEVSDVLKGQVPRTHVIKQIGGVLPDGRSGMIVHGVPKFAVGEEYVLFMAGVSPLGFSSPVGLTQGRFSIEAGRQGKAVASGADFRELTARMPDTSIPATGKPVRQLGLAEFKAMTRARSGLHE
ncbi:MAG TPA: hypothetical protein VFV51_19345 [Vicinamibacterales bacterium]|nr:hypothetical protein [Vicinamibacterales bacterium]